MEPAMSPSRSDDSAEPGHVRTARLLLDQIRAALPAMTVDQAAEAAALNRRLAGHIESFAATATPTRVDGATSQTAPGPHLMPKVADGLTLDHVASNLTVLARLVLDICNHLGQQPGRPSLSLADRDRIADSISRVQRYVDESAAPATPAVFP
jgi:hypothetical protein